MLFSGRVDSSTKYSNPNLLIHLIDQIDDADDLIRNLIRVHEDMCVILREAAHAEQTVQRARQLMAMDKTQLAHAQRQLAVRVRLAAYRP